MNILNCKNEIIDKDKYIKELAERLMKLEIETNEFDHENLSLLGDNKELKLMCKKLENDNNGLMTHNNSVPLVLNFPRPPIISKKKFKHIRENYNNRSFTKSPSITGIDLRQKKSCLNNSFEVGQSPDGKSFFAAVRERLSPDEFKEFVVNLKKFKKKEMPKAELIEYAKSLFGEKNEDLYEGFEAMLFM